MGSEMCIRDRAEIFVKETGCDWLSVAIGNVHGAISRIKRWEKKVEAKLDIEYLKKLNEKLKIPLVLHGGSGIKKEYLKEAFKNGIAKMNIATELRQTYIFTYKKYRKVSKAQESLYEKVKDLIKNYLEAINLIFIPGNIRSGFFICGFNSTILFISTLNSLAIFHSVSPGETVW